MANFAVIIGISAYNNSAWNLDAAVPDALDFTDWALKAGGVPPQNVWLLLSPMPGSNPPIPPDIPALQVKGATGADIRGVIAEFKNKAGQGGERLYVYYAGHGVSAPGATQGWAVEPVLVPTDVVDLEVDYPNLIGFSTLLRGLEDAPPQEQIFFLDACRGFELQNHSPAVGTVVGPPISANQGSSRQFVLYATSLGYSALETHGQGVFGKTLLEGLRGQARQCLASVPPRYEVRFNGLARYVRTAVQKEVEERQLGAKEKYIQIPDGRTSPAVADPVLASFAEDEVAALPLNIYVAPDVARQTCDVEVYYYGAGSRKQLWDASTMKPALYPTKFDVKPFPYVISARADRYIVAEENWDPWHELDIRLTLQADPAGTPIHSTEPDNGGRDRGGVGTVMRIGGEITGFDDERSDAGEESAPPDVATGSLHVQCYDSSILLNLLDPQKREVPAGAIVRGEINLQALPAGIYQVSMTLPEGTVQRQLVEVRPGERTELTLKAPEPDMGSAQREMLVQLGIKVDDEGYYHPSERLGAITSPKLSSLLGFAAYGAQRSDGDFDRLKGLGVAAMDDVPVGASGVLALLGVKSAEVKPGLDFKLFLKGSSLVARGGDGQATEPVTFQPLSGFSAAAQCNLIMEPGPVHLEMRLPGLTATRYSLFALPNRVSVLIVVAGDKGDFEVQQYILPIQPRIRLQQSDFDYLDDPANIRRIELAQRAYSRGRLQQIDNNAIEELLSGKRLDPLMGCLAGYVLHSTGKIERYMGTPVQGASANEAEPSAMRNMLKFFGELPDSHVLAGLCESERREEHYREAVKHGLPIFSEGFRILHEWIRESKVEPPHHFAQASRGLLVGSPWTAWTTTRPALLFRGGDFHVPPGDWSVLTTKQNEITRTARSVGRIELSGEAASPWVGTGFLVSEGAIMTSRHVALAFCERGKGGRWRFKKNVSAWIDFVEELDSTQPSEFQITDIIGIEDNLDIALLGISPISRQGAEPPAPLLVASKAPPNISGREVYMISYPIRDSAPNGPMVESFFPDAYGVKRLLPGEVIDTSQEKMELYHDCFTTPGSAGACVVDLETNLVLGVHFAGRANYKGYYKYNSAVALWMLGDNPLLKEAQIKFA